jgi:hypothetical protein
MIGQNRHRRLHRCLMIARAIKEEVQSNSVTGISEHGVMSAFWRDPAAIAPALVMRKLPVGLLCRRCVRLRCRANHPDISAHPAVMKRGVSADRHDA